MVPTINASHNCIGPGATEEVDEDRPSERAACKQERNERVVLSLARANGKDAGGEDGGEVDLRRREQLQRYSVTSSCSAM